jgi:hypothetical protein
MKKKKKAIQANAESINQAVLHQSITDFFFLFRSFQPVK